MARKEKTRAAQAFEWVLAAAAALAILAIAGYLIREGLRENQETTLSVEAGEAVNGVLPVTVRNTGARTATSVGISLELDQGAMPPVEHHLTIDYVPGNSEVEAAFVLPDGIADPEPRLAIEGYIAP